MDIRMGDITGFDDAEIVNLDKTQEELQLEKDINMYETQIKQVEAVNKLLIDHTKAQTLIIRQLKNTIIAVCICFTAIIVSMIAGFFWYESQFETTESTVTTMETEGENANINAVTNGDMYNDSAQHNDYK